jgi:hypothetical protein
MNRFVLVLHFAFLLLHGAPTRADLPHFVPAKTVAEVLGGTKKIVSVVTKVKTARVLIADYDLLIEDFPYLAGKTHAEIDQWILDHAGYIATSQTFGDDITHTPIELDHSDVKLATRPVTYRRALVLDVEGGVLDLKGAGAEVPLLSSHRNGLMETAEAIREHFFTKAVKKIFAASNSKFGVVDSYAVIDWGFHQKDLKTGAHFRSGSILRRGHVRDLANTSVQGQLTNGMMVEVEKELRPYGVTSAAIRPMPYVELGKIDALNVQGTKDSKFIFDFGSFKVKRKFERQALSLVDWNDVANDRKRGRDVEIHFKYDEGIGPQVDPLHHLNYELWNGAGDDASGEGLRREGRKIAKMLDDQVPLEEVRAHIEKSLAEHLEIENACSLKSVLKVI